MQKFNINWTAKALCNQMERGNVNFDNAVQRSLVWDISKKSLLIHSMLYGYAIPAMYFTRDDNKVYDSLDGKQRSNAIYSYINNEFALSVDVPPVPDDEGNMDDFSGMTFEQLPEWAQDRIKDYNLTIYYYDGMTEDEVREFFRRLNNGKALSAVELTRVQTPCLKEFQKMAKHEAIQMVVSDAGKRRFTDENISMQLYHIATEEAPDFSTKNFREWAKSTEVDPAVMGDLYKGLDACYTFLSSLDLDVPEDKKVYRSVKTRTHFISCSYYCYLAVKAGKSQDEINSTMRHFFSGKPSISEDYNNTVSAGSAKAGAVQTRKEVIDSLMDVKGKLSAHTSPDTDTDNSPYTDTASNPADCVQSVEPDNYMAADSMLDAVEPGA